MIQKIKKLLIYFSLMLVFLYTTFPLYAIDTTTDATPPTQESTTSSPATPTPSPSSPTTDTTSSPTPTPNQTQSSSTTNSSPAPTTTTTVSPTPIPNPVNDPQWNGSTGAPITNAVAGDSHNITSSTQTTNNITPTPTPSNGNTSSVSNTNNGANTTNTNSAQTTNTAGAVQTNTGSSVTTLNKSSVTGHNNASENVGNSTLKTGDANVSGTVITAQNTNVNGVAVAEFNVNDNHNGDLILDFGANCISGCSANSNAQNTDNGAGSINHTNTSSTNTNNTFQNNDGTVGNNLVLTADSGHNLANRNTEGNTTIQTGNANVSANALTFLNNNVAGKVVYGVVNIYGDLKGDILMPQSALDNFTGCGSTCSSTSQQGAANNGNGSGSTNSTTTNQSNTNNLSQTNDATILNNLLFNSTTGNNDATRNTGGNENVTSGKASNDSHVVNVVNSNVADGNVWLVLVNKAGEWLGKIVGMPDGSTVASSGLGFTVAPNGDITASNNGNGAGSTNTTTTTTTNTNNMTQNNHANVGNTLQLSANSGENNANENTGGDTLIKTGDAKIVANIVNFVNNNIVGNGKLFVTVVNVFGKWVGDFVTPGHEKQNNTTSQNQNTTNTNNNSSNSNQTSQTSQNQQSITHTQTTATTTTPVPTIAGTATPLENSVGQQNENGASQAVIGAVSTTLQNGQKTTVAAIHTTAPIRKAIQINLAWSLLGIIPVTLIVFLRKIWRKR